MAELLPELQRLWEECKRAIQAGEIVAAQEAARAALEKAKELERKYPGVGTVLELVKQASDWEKEARGAVSTVAQTANFQKILEEYEGMVQNWLTLSDLQIFLAPHPPLSPLWYHWVGAGKAVPPSRP